MRTSSIVLIVAASLATLACGPRNSDKLDDADLAGASANASAADDTRCMARATNDEVKRQLFARAAEIRGGNGDDYARIADFAELELEGAAPVAATSSKVLADCRGNATLRLPAGLSVAGGRNTLIGDIGYSVAPGARGTVTLGESDSITIPLATLAQRRAGPPPAAAKPDPLEPASEPAPEPEVEPAPVVARPSYDCRDARTQGEQAVCASPALAALDRDMAARYRAAEARADRPQARLLGFTRDRFLAFRDSCPSDACIANAYRGRIREIDDIMANRWEGRLYRRN